MLPPKQTKKSAIRKSVPKKKKSTLKPEHQKSLDEERRLLQELEGEDFETTDFLFISDWSDASLSGEWDK